MIRINSAWHKQLQVKIGDYGEVLVKNFLEGIGYVCYQPVTDRAHLCDFFMFRKDKGTLAAEVKTKPMRDKYPDTGFDMRSYKRYKQLVEEHNMRMYVFFVDEKLKWIYGNFLDVLDKPFVAGRYMYPRDESYFNSMEIRYYPIDKMELIRPLTDKELSAFNQLRGSEKY